MLKPQRRSHRKSKTGCSQCKQRRIKCDEHHPQCYNCKRRESVCRYDGSAPANESSSPRMATLTRSQSSPSQPTPSSTTGTSNEAPSPGVPRLVGLIDSAEKVSSVEVKDDGVSDLELMHHYTLVTAPDLGDNANGPSMIEIWQTHIPRLGFQHLFIMKGILTISALHLANKVPSRRTEFQLKASAHHHVALTSFQKTLPKLDESNCHALLSFSCLLIPIAFAMADDVDFDFLHWVRLIRGGLRIAESHESIVRRSFLAPILEDLQKTNVESSSSYDSPYLDHLSSLFEMSNRIEEREDSRACIVAVHSLISTFIRADRLAAHGEASGLASLIWPAHLSDKFMELLDSRHPEACIILTHYCVLIDQGAQIGMWFLQGYADRILAIVQAALPESYLPKLAWAERMIKGRESLYTLPV